jgi:hypothetical protein
MDVGKQIGPTTTITRSCLDCTYCKSVRYACQGDSGSDVYCHHPARKGDAYIGDTTWRTPAWCPVLAPSARVEGEGEKDG